MSEEMTLTERLRNPAYGQEDRLIADMAEGAETIDRLRASLSEMVGVYWGDGDGHGEPPACIKRAQALLAP